MVNNPCDEIEALLSTVMQRRSGVDEKAEHDGFVDTEEEMHLHQTVDFLSPKEMISVLKPAVAGELVLTEANDKASVTMAMPFGIFKVLSNDLGWSESYPSDNLIIEVHFASIQFNDPKAINMLNIKYPGIGLSQSEKHLVCRREVILKGGRSVENLLWELLAFTQAAERVFKDITVFN
ncbi:hypothetical protein [Rheinheimera hassiensis]|uniref:hypothetical protein n=1 Tax=Rheinheimera hassiensis TaxID=1193627 RepID=UPI001F05A2BE|nr:hypothetical protein [Rheinheimera hassiensis]